MRLVQFKGGPVQLNSGGQGPDDYLLKPLQGGLWTLVIFRFGRNFRWSPEGQVEDLKVAQANGEADREALNLILPVQRVCVPDNARRFQRMKERGSYPVMSATEFVEKYKDSPFVRVR